MIGPLPRLVDLVARRAGMAAADVHVPQAEVKQVAALGAPCTCFVKAHDHVPALDDRAVQLPSRKGQGLELLRIPGREHPGPLPACPGGVRLGCLRPVSVLVEEEPHKRETRRSYLARAAQAHERVHPRPIRVLALRSLEDHTEVRHRLLREDTPRGFLRRPLCSRFECEAADIHVHHEHALVEQ